MHRAIVEGVCCWDQEDPSQLDWCSGNVWDFKGPSDLIDTKYQDRCVPHVVRIERHALRCVSTMHRDIRVLLQRDE